MGRAIAGAILGFVLLGIPLAGFVADAHGGGSDRLLRSLVAVAAAANLGALIGGTGAIVAAIERNRSPQSPAVNKDE
jgi:hypothetical protein